MKAEPVNLKDLSQESLQEFLTCLCVTFFEKHGQNLIKQHAIMDDNAQDGFDKSLALLIKSSQRDAIIDLSISLHENILFLDEMKNHVEELQEQKRLNRLEMEHYAQQIIRYTEPIRKDHEKKSND